MSDPVDVDAMLSTAMTVRVRPITVSELLARVREHEPDTAEHWRRIGDDVQLTGLAGDSRRAAPGELFVAVRGTHDDGARHLGEALARGAVGVVTDAPDAAPAGVPALLVGDARRAKAALAAAFHGYPARALRTVGVTGTNGKTTVTRMLATILTMDGVRVGSMGTLGAAWPRGSLPLSRTTPDPIVLHDVLARMVAASVDTVVLEVSSHALEQQRVAGLDFAAAAYTNLTPEHLDYHQTLERYGAAKARLFEGLDAEARAVLNAEDAAVRAVGSRTRAAVLTYGVEESGAPASLEADVTALVHRLDADGSGFRLRAPDLDVGVASRLVGRHNVSNAACATALALALGVSAPAIETGLAALEAVPGRLQSVECGQDFRVFVDYAHTPDALEQVLATVRPLARRRLIVVFGCGGERDRAKRPRMGAAAAACADVVLVTSDNPRGEDPAAIVDEVLAGVPPGARAQVDAQIDRRLAIETACRSAHGGDVVLIAGKGHETTQTIGDRVIPFDDVQVVRECLWSL